MKAEEADTAPHEEAEGDGEGGDLHGEDFCVGPLHIIVSASPLCDKSKSFVFVTCTRYHRHITYHLSPYIIVSSAII